MRRYRDTACNRGDVHNGPAATFAHAWDNGLDAAKTTKEIRLHHMSEQRHGAEIYFWDESGFRADAVQGKTWGVKGHTPIVEGLAARNRFRRLPR
jgi:hypothetical protein